MLPQVSILIATRDRHKFIPYLLEIINSQTYPHDLIELVVGDDGHYSSRHLFPKNTNYLRYSQPVKIGKKRNDLKKIAKGCIMVTMDDDDYYFPEYINHAVDLLINKNKNNIGLAVLTTAYIFYPNRWLLQISGPWYKSWPGASFVYTKKYAEEHYFNDRVISGEERSFTNNFEEPVLELDYLKTMIILSHKRNTSNKNNLGLRHECKLKIIDLIPNKKLLKFYQLLGFEINQSGPIILHI